MFRSIQEQEEFDHEIGCATEQQNAYALAHMEWRRVWDWPLIKEALGDGKVVLIREWTSYCPFTDAILGGNMELVRTYEPDEELPELEFNEEITLSYRYPCKKDPDREPVSDDDIPF